MLYKIKLRDRINNYAKNKFLSILKDRYRWMMEVDF